MVTHTAMMLPVSLWGMFAGPCDGIPGAPGPPGHPGPFGLPGHPGNIAANSSEELLKGPFLSYC